MNILDTIRNVLQAAQGLTAAIPGLQGVSGVAGAANALVGVLDQLMDKAPDNRTQEEMQAARRELAAAITAKGEALADRLDG